jgi:hypothetical protein
MLLATMTVALVLVAGVSLAKPEGDKDKKGGASSEPLEKVDTSVPTEGLTAPVPSENGEIKVVPSSPAKPVEQGIAASQAKWLTGTSSNTHYWNPIHNQMQLLTTEMISYWGTEDGTYPKVGELYWGKVTIGNVNPSMGTPVMAEVELPRDTKFALVDGDPNMKITCVLDNFNTGGSQQLTGDLCPTAPKQPGTYEPYQLSPKGGYWTIKPGEAISVIFPIYSTSELKGWAGTPADCISSSVWAAASWEVWDKPEAADSCPVSNGDGVDQGVWVAPNPPTVQYPTPSATKVTATGATTTGHLYYHFQPGTAFLDLGTTTSYGKTVSLGIPNTHDALAVSNDWTGLNPNTTYHWRLRFVDNQGRTFTGADQTFTTAAPPPDTTAPRVTRVVPAENATGIAPATNVSAFFSEAMRATTVSASTVKLYKVGSTTVVPAAVTYDATTKKATLNPNANLQLGAKYKVVVAGARDAAGNVLDQDPNLTGNQPKSWFFTIRQ